MNQAPSTVLGFDYGLRRIGVAVGQTLTATATPLTTIHAQDGQPDWESIGALISEWSPKALVVGLPLNMDGTEHEMTQAARTFAAQLQTRYHRPVHLVDERLSSLEAERILNAQGKRGRSGKTDIDKIAAQLILQSWLAQQGNAL